MFRIGIAGGSGSGKTTIVRRLLDSDLGPHLACLHHDAYYRNRVDMPDHLREAMNWDHPDALDNTLFAQDIDRLISGHAVSMPVYDFATHSRTALTVTIEPKPVLLVEGILLLAIPEIRQRLDLCAFVDTPDDLRIVRRALRDVKERKRTMESVAEQYSQSVRPMYLTYVEPSRRHAQIIIPWEAENPAAIDVLTARIRMAIDSGTRHRSAH